MDFDIMWSEASFYKTSGELMSRSNLNLGVKSLNFEADDDIDNIDLNFDSKQISSAKDMMKLQV